MKKKGDVIIVIFIIIAIICAALSYLLSSDAPPKVATVSYDGNVVKTISLTVDRVYSYPIYNSNDEEICCIEIEDSRVRFQSSTCADQICVDAGWLEHSGDFMVCAPNKVVVTVQ